MSEMGSMADLDVEHRHVWFPASYGHHSDMRCYGRSRPLADQSLYGMGAEVDGVSMLP
jgi:hypothetical protein